MRKSFNLFLVVLLALSPLLNAGFVYAGNEESIQSPIIQNNGSVTFNVVHESEELYIVGSFNEWDITNAIKMEKKNNIFTKTLELDSGTYEYKFVEGNSWEHTSFKDEFNPLEYNGNSVVTVEIQEQELYEFTINYYRYDDVVMNWDLWIFGENLEGDAYQFSELKGDYATGSYELPLGEITVITRSGNWNSQEVERKISIPSDKKEVEVWIVQGDENVYYEEPEIDDEISVPTVRFSYEREDKDYDDWNIWVWNTGVQDDQINFDDINTVAIANIEVSKSAKNIGFKLRKGEEWNNIDVDQDREITISPTEGLTKVFVRQGEADFYTIPFASAPVMDNGVVTFYYRDADLYYADKMNSIDSVKMKINDKEYDMTYETDKERYIHKIEDLENGQYEYTYLVTVDGNTVEIADPYNVSSDGKSFINLSSLQIDITAALSMNSINYNQQAVLSIALEVDEEEIEEQLVQEAYVDLTALGGREKVFIDPALNAITISVKDTISTGLKVLPVIVKDVYGDTHNTEIEINVEPRELNDSTDFDWDEARIYFMLTDRFADGNVENNQNIGFDRSGPGNYHGGDFKGLTENIDYLVDLGINTIWITPIVENIYHDVAYNDSGADGIAYHGYHGYWAKNFEKLNPHLGTLAEFHELIDEASDNGIKIMVDVVLNHTGYGLKADDSSIQNPPEGYPSEEDRSKFESMIRQDGGSGDVKGELAGLPDFITEDPEVRHAIVDWQVDWLEKSRTSNGNTIDYFRVDTVKHVEDTTWMHFKNELTLAQAEFKLIGEAWGAGPNNQYANKYLDTGMMDSLLDFEFKSLAKDLVNGRIESVNQKVQARNDYLNNTATLGQFLGSHDEDGFLHYINAEDDPNKIKIAASLQVTSKGQPVIYYGEELGLSGIENWPYYDNRYDFPWNEVAGNDIHAHYTKMLNVRKDFSKVFSKGSYKLIEGNDNLGYMIFERNYQDKTAIVGINTKNEAIDVSINTPYHKDSQVTDEYSKETLDINGQSQVEVNLPSAKDGGTVVLVSNQDDKKSEDEEVDREIKPIAEGSIRIHYQRADDHYSNLGLWLWDDVEVPSEENDGGWPAGATPFKSNQATDYGLYLDVPVKSDAGQVGLLVLDMGTGEKDGDDKIIELFSPEIKEVWIKQGTDEVSFVAPIDLPDNILRIHFKKSDDNYTGLGIWTWKDVVRPSENWPIGAQDYSEIGKYGAYYDVELIEDAKEIGFLFLNKDNSDQTNDYTYTEISANQIFIEEGDENIYMNPYGSIPTLLLSGEIISDKKIELRFTTTEKINMEELIETLTIRDKHDNVVSIASGIIKDEKYVELSGLFDLEAMPYLVTYKDKSISIASGWKMIDELFAYDGELGAKLNNDGSATLKVWSPKANEVTVILYDKDDQFKVVQDRLPMELGDQGVWQIDLNKANTDLDSLQGYYYHYEITHGDNVELALDPYAKSMAAWANEASGGTYSIGKAAIVDPSTIGPDLNYAEIDGFEKREDAIIYEVHVRDFTSDESIGAELESQFGTFPAFIEKLDYIQDLGVTHVQLLPVMSYYFGDEWASNERILEWSSSQNNYNWGYDPHSYFSLTGMYSENPDNPEKRIEEFKMLIDEIHQRDMGVILDVVYNHTAQVDIFESLVPNYYHFMDADGTARESFGGGRLGTTHEMSRRILVDSITYWVEEFKVDGFRFDMMGDHDAETIQIAYDKAKELNPNIVMIGEGWVTYAGDEGDSVMPADQQWMQHTESVGSFSDEFRNELKSGFGSEGQPRFLTGGARNIQQIFNNLTANPSNFNATNPGDVVPYIAAHDNLTLHDVIAQSIKKDPDYHQEEIHKRIRLGNLMVLTAQGTSFIHAGQEFGRTKQFREGADEAPYKSTYMVDETDKPFNFPYFIHDSYDSSDIINKFDWEKAMNEQAYPINHVTKEYTKGLIHLRRSTDAFSLGTIDEITERVSLINAPEINESDLVIGYQATSSDDMETYYVFVNADDKVRTLTIDNLDLTAGKILVDKNQAGVEEILEPIGFDLSAGKITIDPLTSVVIKVVDESENPSEPGDGDSSEPGGGDSSEPGDGDSSEPGDGDSSEPGDGDSSEPGDGDSSESGDGDSDESGDGDSSEPGDGDSSEPGDGDSSEPGDGDSSESGDGDSSEPGDGDSSDRGEEESSELSDNSIIIDDHEEDSTIKLPKTATPYYRLILVGLILMLMGGVIYLIRKKQVG